MLELVILIFLTPVSQVAKYCEECSKLKIRNTYLDELLEGHIEKKTWEKIFFSEFVSDRVLKLRPALK